MRKIIGFVTVLLMLGSCSTINEWRRPASFGRDLNGTYLGVADYKFGRRGPNKAATRLYLHEIEGERGSYNAVLLEYVNLLDMAPEYVAAAKAPAVNKVIGYLKNITRKIYVYKVVPAEAPGTFNMYQLMVDRGNVVPDYDTPARKLILREGSLKHPLEGARITGPADEKKFKEIFFPMKDDKKHNGIQYSLANFVYKNVGLDSTWRKSYLPGPYLSAYGRMNDEILTLSRAESGNVMEFKINPAMSSKSKRSRERMFTNAKSAFMQGTYTVTEPQDGMFLVQPVESDKETRDILAPRIGLFIDIFDATEALNQDVVELVFVDPAHPEDFLMYYEHPENGEGE